MSGWRGEWDGVRVDLRREDHGYHGSEEGGEF